MFLGVAVTSGAREQVIPFLDRGLSPEYELTRSIRVVAQTERRKVGIVDTDLRILGGLDFATMQNSAEWSVVAELRKQYDVATVTPDGPIDETALDTLRVSFEDEYERTYGFRAQRETAQIVHLRLIAEGLRPQVEVWRAGTEAAVPADNGTIRPAYFGPEFGSRDTPVLGRGDLGRDPQQGPLIVAEYDSTTVIPPGCRAVLDDLGSIVITFED